MRNAENGREEGRPARGLDDQSRFGGPRSLDVVHCRSRVRGRLGFLTGLHGDDQIFELTIAAALGAGDARLRAGLAALNEALR